MLPGGGSHEYTWGVPKIGGTLGILERVAIRVLKGSFRGSIRV